MRHLKELSQEEINTLANFYGKTEKFKSLGNEILITDRIFNSALGVEFYMWKSAPDSEIVNLVDASDWIKIVEIMNRERTVIL